MCVPGHACVWCVMWYSFRHDTIFGANNHTQVVTQVRLSLSDPLTALPLGKSPALVLISPPIRNSLSALFSWVAWKISAFLISGRSNDMISMQSLNENRKSLDSRVLEDDWNACALLNTRWRIDMWHETRIQGSGKECNCQQDAMNEAASSRSFWEAIRAVLGFKGRCFEWMCFYLKPEYTHCNVKEKWHKGTLMTAAPTFFKVCDPFIPHYTLSKKNTVVSDTLQYGHLHFQ